MRVSSLYLTTLEGVLLKKRQKNMLKIIMKREGAEFNGIIAAEVMNYGYEERGYCKKENCKPIPVTGRGGP
jgi:hypothetical protein